MVIDGFMGAGGFSVALDMLGIESVGIELDAAPIAVARAAGHNVIQGDIAAFDPLEFAPCEGCCMSPPCPSFSSAGRGAGREISEPILAAIADLAEGRDTRERRRREAYAILEPDTARFDVLPVTRRRRKREQRAASPVDRDRIARRKAKRATAKRDAAISLLVVEPLRWALALEPRWIALEQVPPVLPLWEAMAAVLRERGYSVWCGILSSERYGVPQTRQRAILIASLDHEVREPPATHQRYIAPRKRADDGMIESLFEPPEPERIVHREDRELLPWVSMAVALQWPAGREVVTERGAGMCERHGERPSRSTEAPAPTVTAGTKRCGPRWAVVDRTRADGEWMPQDLVGFPRRNDRPDDGEYRERDLRAASEPAFGLTEKVRSWTRFVSNGQANATVRDIDEPAPTIATGHSTSERRWVLRSGQSVAGEGRAERSVARDRQRRIIRTDLCSWEPPTHYDRRQEQGPRREDGSRERVRLLSVDEPAPTQQAEALAKGRDVWVTERPSTSVNCDPRIAEPGRHDPDESGSQYGAATVRVSIAEAAALQGFPNSYPWEAAGTKTAAFRSIGNAICPPLALHVLAMATGREIP